MIRAKGPMLSLTATFALVCASCVRVVGAPADETQGAPRLLLSGSAEDGGGSSDGDAAIPSAPAPAPAEPDADLPAITFRGPLPSSLGATSPAVKYADMSQGACKAEVKKRDLPVIPLKTAQRGVSGGLRIDGSMNGVKIVAPPSSTKFGILDCRLALVIDDFTKALHESGVVRLTIDNMYRPHAKLPGRRKASQHAFGLAIDITSFQLEDGRVLSTADWGASIGEVPCGPDAVMASPTAAGIDVRNLVCSVARAGLFNTMLSPSYDAAHQSHFHFDIKSDTTRLSVR
ncbi:MAG: hypothetical protein HOV80_35195 [Polyangiaceae bacterium]|nr:hypothetical protein [Polyangiaceae bacterium]